MLFFQVRRDLSSFYLSHHVEAVPSSEVRHSDLAVGTVPSGATGYSIWHHLRVQQRLGGLGHGTMLDEADPDRTRLRDIDHAVLRLPDDYHHRSLHTDRDQAQEIEAAHGYRQEEPFAWWTEPL